MLLPRFSISTLLLVITGVAVVSLFAGQALGGRVWAVGLTAAVVSVPAALFVHAIFFRVCSMLAQMLGAQEIVARTSRGGVERSSTAAAASSPTPES